METFIKTIAEAHDLAKNPKFRLKVIEHNDGTKMYHPQTLVPVDIRIGLKLFNRPTKIVYAWRGFQTTNDGYDTLSSTQEGDGCGSGDKEDALKMIERYKLSQKKKWEIQKEKALETENKKVKQISIIEI